MAFWPHYQKGDPPPRSARRENGISDLLNGVGMLSGGGIRRTAGAETVIPVYNISAAPRCGLMVPVFDRPEIGGATAVRPWLKGDSMYLWLPEELKSGQIGAAVAQGRITVPISGEPSAFAVPGDDGKSFKFADSGLPVLGILQSDGRSRAVLLLGQAATSGYTGYFAVVPAEDAADGTKQIKIIDNANPDAGIAGYTDLNDDPVPAVTLAAHSGRLFLFATWQEEANEYKITFGFSSSPEKSGFMYIQLADLVSIDNRFSIYQRWRRNETACFGERYWI